MLQAAVSPRFQEPYAMAGPRRTASISLAKGPVGILGIVAIAFGVLGFIVGGRSFKLDFPSGTVTGAEFIGVLGNGWTWLLFAAAGVLLLLGTPAHWGAKTMALLVGLVFVIAAIIGVIDGHDVLGVVAVNGLTKLILAVAGVVLLVLSRAPRVGGRLKAGPAPRGMRDAPPRDAEAHEATASQRS
jgi:hypothetical protein